jgi:extracellular solute-binding protein (family 5)
MEDPVVGGYTPEKIALRRAIGMGYDVQEFIRVILKGRGVPANGPIPPDVAGYDPKLKTSAQLYDPAAARALLDRFGYKDRDGDGYREMPDGKPLVLERWSAPTLISRQEDEQLKKNMDAIGLRIAFRKDRLQELRKMARQGRLSMRTDGWNADYPDAENFMQVLYGPNVGQENHARFSLPEFDRLFEAAQATGLPGAHRPLRPHDRDRDRLRAVAHDGASHRGSPRAAVGAELQAAPCAVVHLALRRRRSLEVGSDPGYSHAARRSALVRRSISVFASPSAACRPASLIASPSA